MTPVYREKMEYFSAPFVWNHRQTDEADIYFLSNQERRSRNIEVAFRVTGRVPEFWNAETGDIRDAGVWRQENGRTVVQIRFAPAGSVFVVFRCASEHADPVARITPQNADMENGILSLWIEDDRVWASKNGMWKLTRQSGKTESISVTDLPKSQEISGSWIVTFPPGRGAPKQIELPELLSLGEHKNAGVKHFSGTATYSCKFMLPKMQQGDRLFLDLGRLANLAEVTVNGKNLGVLWKPPFAVEVTNDVQAGKNTLTIAATNTWRNRLIGDAGLPAEDRTTWILFEEIWLSPEASLEPAGLMGPVFLQTARSSKIE